MQRCIAMAGYGYIFKQLFMNTLLDFKPIDIEEFYDICLRVIRSDRLSNLPMMFQIPMICEFAWKNLLVNMNVFDI